LSLNDYLANIECMAVELNQTLCGHSKLSTRILLQTWVHLSVGRLKMRDTKMRHNITGLEIAAKSCYGKPNKRRIKSHTMKRVKQ